MNKNGLLLEAIQLHTAYMLDWRSGFTPQTTTDDSEYLERIREYKRENPPMQLKEYIESQYPDLYEKLEGAIC